MTNLTVKDEITKKFDDKCQEHDLVKTFLASSEEEVFTLQEQEVSTEESPYIIGGIIGIGANVGVGIKIDNTNANTNTNTTNINTGTNTNTGTGTNTGTDNSTSVVIADCVKKCTEEYETKEKNIKSDCEGDMKGACKRLPEKCEGIMHRRN